MQGNRFRLPRTWQAVAAGAAVLGACAWLTHRFTHDAGVRNPPRGNFVAAGGLRLHYTEHGKPDAPPLVLLHGCGSMGREIELSGLVEAAAREFRVLVFDRPGYGHSDTPVSHTTRAQAALLMAALRALDVRKPLVLGHSWGAMVAFAMALDHPDEVRGVVLASGYHTPSVRLDLLLTTPPAIPLLGTLLRHTISPLVGRALWPLMLKRVFSPGEVNPAFRRNYPVWMSLRPKALESSATESALMATEAAKLRLRARELEVPAVLVAGAKDRLVMTFWQAGRLARVLGDAPLHVVENAGHMVHHTDAEAVMDAVREAFERSSTHLKRVPLPERNVAPEREAMRKEVEAATLANVAPVTLH